MLSQADKPLYPASNKNVIYLARDAFVAFGYSGLARLGLTPTDDWIARQLAGVADWGPPPTPWMSQVRLPQWLDIGRAVQRLTDRLNDAFTNQVSLGLQNFPHEVIVAGWQWKWRGSRARPIAWTISREDGESFVCETHFPRHEYGPGFIFGAIPSSANKTDAVQEARQALQAGAALDHHAAETLFVEVIRRVASERPGVVGPHCMSIYIYPPRAEVRFIPDSRLVEERSLPGPMQKLGVTFAIGPAPVDDTLEAAPVGGVYAPWMVLGVGSSLRTASGRLARGQ